MFENWSYIGYTLMFCVPPLVLFWLRREFFLILKDNIKVIFLSVLVLTVYGSLIWPVALKYGAWAYSPDRITNAALFQYVYVDDVIWWIFVSLLLASFIVVSAYYEDRGRNIFLEEIKGCLRSFYHAFQGFPTITLERNSTIHVGIAVFVMIEAIFLKISRLEWFIVIGLVGLVLALELVNSSIERLASRISPEADPDVKVIKDTAAAAVLIASIAAAVVGVKIFLSRMLAFLM
ncbi:diacylglycerol kinase family protein [candidate division KSB1 bacterium]